MDFAGTFRDTTLCSLTPVDNWNNEHHRRCVAASLVQGVYTLERARQGQRSDDLFWWEFFGFKLLDALRDERDNSFFGAVYEYNNSTSIITPNTPRYVIAFRGTLLKRYSIYEDIKLDLKLIRNRIEQKRHRFHTAKEAVEKIIYESGNSNVWLAGHSLGAAIALFCGKEIMKMGRLCSPIETYLFNQPYISAPIEWIKNEKLKQGIHHVRTLAIAGLAIATSKTHQNDSFSKLDSWMPNLFVNPGDLICSGYIGYFEQRKKWVELGAEIIGRIATQHTLRSFLPSSHQRDLETLHLLPSAHLIINRSPSSSARDAHKLEQWWINNDNYESKSHRFRTMSSSSNKAPPLNCVKVPLKKCRCGRVAILKISQKEWSKDCLFYSCPGYLDHKQPCNFFLWCEDNSKEDVGADATSSKCDVNKMNDFRLEVKTTIETMGNKLFLKMIVICALMFLLSKQM